MNFEAVNFPESSNFKISKEVEVIDKSSNCSEDDGDPLMDYRNSVWKRKSTKLLLLLCKEHISDFCDYTKKRKYIWESIAEKLRQQGYYVTADTCDNKWRNMLKTYRKTVNYNEQQGVIPRKCPFFDEINSVLNKHSVNSKQCKCVSQNRQDDYEYLIQKRTGIIWDTKSLKHLISSYKDHQRDFSDDRIKKRYVWDKVAESMRKRGCIISSDSCEAKWKNLIRKFKYTLDDNGQPTAETLRSPLYQEIVDLIGGVSQQTSTNCISQLAADQWPQRKKPTGFVWDLHSTKLLISLYSEIKINTSEHKKSKLWTAIAQAMCKKGYIVTASTCDAKWRKVFKIFKSALQYNNRTGNIPTKCWFFKEMKELCGQLTENKTFVKHSKQKKKRKKMNRNIINKKSLELEEVEESTKVDIISWLDTRKEEQDRREKEKMDVLMQMHKERMELLDTLIQILKT